MRPKLSVVIAVWDGLEHLVRCVESLYKHTTVPWELVLVNNGSTDGAAAYCEHLEDTKPNVIVLHNAENRNFGPAQNQGAAVSTGDYICNLNSDVVVTPQWFERMLACLEAPYPFPVAFVGPVSNMSAGRQIVPKGYKDLSQLDYWADHWYQQQRGNYFEVGTLFGWCLLSKRETWEKIGGFDERFSNAFEDNDLSLRATLAGYKLRVAGDTFLHHHGQGTILSHGDLDKYAANGVDQRAKFVEKWRSPGKKKLVAVMRIANCERTIKQVLDRTAEFANAGIIVHLCRSTDKTEEIARAHPAVRRVEVYDGPFQEDYERNSLLQWALELQAAGEADWCISVDGDELYDHRMVERVQELMNPAWPHTFAYWCNWRTIWERDEDGREWYRADDTFGHFKNYRFFRLFPGLKIVSNHPEGHHCGSAPIFPSENLRWCNVRVKHLGYDTPELRKRKFDFYQAADNFKSKGDIGHEDYRHLISRTVQLREYKERNEISIVALLGNEGPWLTGFFEHLAPLADEVVIVDTLREGEESDGTIERARQWATESMVPVKFVRIPWQDNYALMRNLAKEHATKDWVLMMDPDERFDPTEVQVLFDMMDDPAIQGYLFHVLNYVEPKMEGRPPKYISSDAIRMFRNLPELYYTGVVHETIEDAVAARKQRGEFVIAEAPLAIHHHGYLKPVEKVKHKMVYYTDLNRKQIEVTDGVDPRPYFNLAMHFMEEGDYRAAEDALKTAQKLGPHIWRSRTTLVSVYMMQAKKEMEAILAVTDPQSAIYQTVKKTLDVVNSQPFLHRSALVEV